MNLEFFKYHGTGNDFIIFDNRKGELGVDEKDFFQKICDRHFSIGADGVILIEEHPTLDFKMIYFNSDGREGSMCGNGGRCAVAFANTLGLLKNETKFYAYDGEHQAVYLPNEVSLKMGDVNKIDSAHGTTFINTGSPHLVLFRKELDEMNLVEEGRKIRYSEPYRAEGVNVNFVQVEGEGLRMRTYERGVEDETLSCGTGTVASALAHDFLHANEMTSKETLINSPGGNLKVAFTRKGQQNYSDIWLKGGATFVFKGSIDRDF